MPFAKSILFISLAAVSVTASAQTAREKREAQAMARLAKLLTGYSAGESQSCIDPRAVRNPEAFGEKTLIFRQGKIIWRNDTGGGCEELGDDRLAIDRFGSRMCAGDRAYTVDMTGDDTGSCLLGDFVPYRKDAAAK